MLPNQLQRVPSALPSAAPEPQLLPTASPGQAAQHFQKQHNKYMTTPALRLLGKLLPRSLLTLMLILGCTPAYLAGSASAGRNEHCCSSCSSAACLLRACTHWMLALCHNVPCGDTDCKRMPVSPLQPCCRGTAMQNRALQGLGSVGLSCTISGVHC